MIYAKSFPTTSISDYRASNDMQDDITKKVEALKAAGFEPVSILMSRWLYREINEANGAGAISQSRRGDDLVMTMQVMRNYNGLPVHVCLNNDKSFSIEVA